MTLVPASQALAVPFGDIEDTGQDVDRTEARPPRAMLADKVIGEGDGVFIVSLIGYVVREDRAEQVGLGPQPDQLTFHLPSVLTGRIKEASQAGITGHGFEFGAENIADHIRELLNVLMRRGKQEVIEERGIQDPEEVTKTPGMKSVNLSIVAWRCRQGERRTKELPIVSFVCVPDADVAVQVFGEIDEQLR